MERTDAGEPGQGPGRLKPGRGRRKAEDVRHATLTAAAELLLAEGVHALTFSKVATRAGVSKMTLYKWWPSPGALAFDAYFNAFQATLAFPDTGDIRRDLTAQLNSFVDLLNRNAPVIAGIIGAAQGDADLAEALSTHYVTHRRALAVERLTLAQQAGQVRADAHLEAIVDQLWGAVYHRLLMPALPMTPEFVDELIANLFHGIAVPEAGKPAT
ncbi:TetR-like C-terminal domain-containing protein [Streptomyces montanisoli]|uniref:TetR/AcrR family transcriptional regulator C-terminal ligand-binding domain-containing protein n=1 Tax=Streptomyces montanisoli TaxID=2798581 RepID=A0A940MCW7_9ACTN|nr:TetR-like C-terminal domain-containing protein [Streptomyces montanisoli]MBP0458959.1 TetR/AcrR family transcriptional regulator C-terminal ligand-binding domain-containing protein [Streptomyces montanisoli]